MHTILIPTTMESEKSYLINCKDLVDGRIDESIKKIDGRLVIATDHNMHETTFEEEVMCCQMYDAKQQLKKLYSSSSRVKIFHATW